MDDLLRTIGLCKKAGMLEVGEEPVGAACRARQCRLLLLAEDAADNTRRRADHFAEAGQCIMLTIPYEKDDLGSAVGRTSCAMLAVTDIGFASSLVKKLSASEPERYGAAAEKLAVKAEKAALRRKEQLVHEKRKRKKV